MFPKNKLAQTRANLHRVLLHTDLANGILTTYTESFTHGNERIQQNLTRWCAEMICRIIGRVMCTKWQAWNKWAEELNKLGQDQSVSWARHRFWCLDSEKSAARESARGYGFLFHDRCSLLFAHSSATQGAPVSFIPKVNELLARPREPGWAQPNCAVAWTSSFGGFGKIREGQDFFLSQHNATSSLQLFVNIFPLETCASF